MPAKGSVTLVGEPAPAGQLVLAPVGGGSRAVSLVDDSGAFSLRSSDGAGGVYPGQYQATFQHGLSGQDRKKIAAAVKGYLEVDEITIVYRSFRDNLVTIPETGVDGLVIDINPKNGWERLVTD